MTFEEAIKSKEYLYCRAKSWRADGSIESDNDYIVRAYGRDRGVIVAMGSMNGLSEAKEILAKHGKAFA